MKPRSKTHSLLSCFVIPMSVCMAFPMVVTTASAAPTTISYATPAAYGEAAVASTAASSTITVADGTKYAVGDVIRLFFSYRYTPDRVRHLLARHQIAVLEHWITRSGEEGVFLCRKK